MHARARLAVDDRGAVYAEIAIAIIPLFSLMMGVAQLALIAQASLVVRHAAQCAARSAVVVLDDDESYYTGSPRLMIESEGGPGILTAVVAAMNGSPGLPEATRIGVIRGAAFRPLLGIAPGPSQVASGRAQSSIRHAIGGASNDRLAFGVAYLDAAAAVTFPDGPGSTSMRSSFAPDEPVTVRVTMAYPCLVPLVAEFICDPMSELQNSDLAYAARPGGLGGILDGRVRYRLIEAEATLTNQGAPYPYP